MTVLKTALATYPHTRELKKGTVMLPGIRLEHVEIAPIRDAIHRMCRNLEFDVCEMAVTAYLTAKAYGKPFTALPVFVMRQFPHALMVYNVKSGIASPKDLEGKKVGIRAYTVTTGVWGRGILATKYGVDLDKITWVAVEEEHVEEYQNACPPNVTYRIGGNLQEMVATGELAAAIGVRPVDSPDVKPLIPDGADAAAAWYRETGIYPINHMVVVRDSLLQSQPELGPQLFNAFKEAKEAFLAQLDLAGELSADAQALAHRRNVVGNDPLPYGLQRNRKAVEAIIQLAQDQKILQQKVKAEEMFASNTLDLE